MFAIRILIIIATIELFAILVLLGGWIGLFFAVCEAALAALFTRALGRAAGNDTARSIIADAEAHCPTPSGAGGRRR
jgi:UPF0716 family protein affecting phage T7 exclusion